MAHLIWGLAMGNLGRACRPGLRVHMLLPPLAVVHPECPLDSIVFPGNGHCYWLGAEKAEWLEAQRHCKEYGSGDLAFVSSPEIQSFLVSQVTR